MYYCAQNATIVSDKTLLYEVGDVAPEPDEERHPNS